MRRTPMPGRSKPIGRNVPLQSSGPQARRTGSRRANGTPTDRQAAHDRDKGRCVRCGAPATDLDHVQGRGAGGTTGERADRISGVAWLRTLCGHGNASGCHGWKERNADAARILGYRLDRNGIQADASQVPVWTWRGWVRFTADGRVTAVTGMAPPAGDLAVIHRHHLTTKPGGA